MVLQTAEPGIWEGGAVSLDPLRIYTGLLGQIGDIIAFGPTLRRMKELFPNSQITFAVSKRYREAAELLAGLSYIDRIFVTDLYFEKLDARLFQPWERGWPVDLRGEDEVREQRMHDLVLETRPRHPDPAWRQHRHHVAELAIRVRVPGPIDLQTEIAVPCGTVVPRGAGGKIVFHNDPNIDPKKGWPWPLAVEFLRRIGPERVVLLGNPGPEIPGALDLRGTTSLAQAAAIIEACRCFVGIESGPTCIAGALQAPTVALFGSAHRAYPEAVQPVNPRAQYLTVDGPLDQIPPELVEQHTEEVLERFVGKSSDST